MLELWMRKERFATQAVNDCNLQASETPNKRPAIAQLFYHQILPRNDLPILGSSVSWLSPTQPRGQSPPTVVFTNVNAQDASAICNICFLYSRKIAPLLPAQVTKRCCGTTA